MTNLEFTMVLKEVGASGQISLGKKYAGQLFELRAHPDGRLEMLPMKAVPARQQVPGPEAPSSANWLPPGGYNTCSTWALENKAALEAYARRIQTHGTAAEQMQAFLSDAHKSDLGEAHQGAQHSGAKASDAPL